MVCVVLLQPPLGTMNGRAAGRIRGLPAALSGDLTGLPAELEVRGEIYMTQADFELVSRWRWLSVLPLVFDAALLRTCFYTSFALVGDEAKCWICCKIPPAADNAHVWHWPVWFMLSVAGTLVVWAAHGMQQCVVATSWIWCSCW